VARDKTGMERRHMASDHGAGDTLMRFLQEVAGDLDELRTEERRTSLPSRPPLYRLRSGLDRCLRPRSVYVAVRLVEPHASFALVS